MMYAPDRRLTAVIFAVWGGYLAVFLLLPLMSLLVDSTRIGDGGFGLQNYRRCIALTPASVTTATVVIAAEVTTISMGIALCCSLLALSLPGRILRVASLTAVLPLMLLSVNRAFCWLALGFPGGPLRELLAAVGVDAAPGSEHGARVYVVVGLVHLFAPLSFVMSLAVMQGVPRNLILAARSLGATHMEALWRITLAVSSRELIGIAVLVFLLAGGAFITPSVLGGGRDTMISSLVDYYLNVLVDRPLTSALGTLVAGVAAVGLWIALRFADLRVVFDSD